MPVNITTAIAGTRDQVPYKFFPPKFKLSVTNKFKVPRKKGGFRTQANLHFLTYPQCDMPVNLMLEQLKLKAGDKYGWCVISAEDHEERENDSCVGVHRHVMQEYNGKFETANERYWDLKWEDKVFHPHFEPVKKKSDCLRYVIKDGDYIQDGNYKDAPFSVETYLQANKGKQGYGFTFIANEIKKGTTLDQLDDLVPGHVLNHKRKIDEYIIFTKQKKERLIPKPKFPGFQKERRMPYDWERVVDWANLNFLQPRQPRQAQLWLWSRQPEMGKSYPWAIILRKYFKCYEWIYGPKQGQDIIDCDYILIDELKGGITVGELKTLSQMYGMNLDIKYGVPQMFDKNVPLIITSNLPPREIYHKCKKEDIESLESRFLVINVDEQYFLKVKEEPQELSPTTTQLLLGDTEPAQEQFQEATPDILLEKQDMSEEDLEKIILEDSDNESTIISDENSEDLSEYSRQQRFIKKIKNSKK